MREEKGKIVILFCFIFIDQFSKYFALKLNFGFINKGISFGWFSSSSLLSNCLVTLLSIFMLGLIFCKFRDKLFAILILSGGISNLIDRVFRGGVVDFIKLPLIPFFNLADGLICLGVALFLIDFIKAKKLS